MSFPARLTAVCSALALLLAAFVLGSIFSPERIARRNAGAPLVSFTPSVRVSAVDIFARASDSAPLLTLTRQGANLWQASSGSLSYPASSDRVAALLQGLQHMRRGNLVTRDPSKRSELGLDNGSAHMVRLRVEGRPDVTLLVGKRAASGDEEYVMARGEPSAYLTRSAIGILLDQDRTYWYDLRVLPADIQGSTILSISVRGSIRLGPQSEGALRGDYTLARTAAASSGQGTQAGQPTGWQIEGQKTEVNVLAASTMAERIASLEGVDFAQAPPARSSVAGGLLQVTVLALNGDRYILRVSPGPEPGKLFLTTSFSPLAYVVDSLTLSRTVFPLSDLLAGP